MLSKPVMHPEIDLGWTQWPRKGRLVRIQRVRGKRPSHVSLKLTFGNKIGAETPFPIAMLR